MGQFNSSVEFKAEQRSLDREIRVVPQPGGKYSSVLIEVKEVLPRGRGRPKTKRLSILFPLDPETAMALGALLTQWGAEAKEERDAVGS